MKNAILISLSLLIFTACSNTTTIKDRNIASYNQKLDFDFKVTTEECLVGEGGYRYIFYKNGKEIFNDCFSNKLEYFFKSIDNKNKTNFIVKHLDNSFSILEIDLTNEKQIKVLNIPKKDEYLNIYWGKIFDNGHYEFLTNYTNTRFSAINANALNFIQQIHITNLIPFQIENTSITFVPYKSYFRMFTMQGNLISDYLFTKIPQFDSENALATIVNNENKEKQGIITKSGQFIIKPIYDSIALSNFTMFKGKKVYFVKNNQYFNFVEGNHNGGKELLEKDTYVDINEVKINEDVSILEVRDASRKFIIRKTQEGNLSEPLYTSGSLEKIKFCENVFITYSTMFKHTFFPYIDNKKSSSQFRFKTAECPIGNVANVTFDKDDEVYYEPDTKSYGYIKKYYNPSITYNYDLSNWSLIDSK